MIPDLFTPLSETGGPFGLAEAAHLARRAGFGVSAAEARALAALGPDLAVARFVDFPDVDAPLEAALAERGGPLVDFAAGPGVGPVDPARRWWLYRMVHGAAPLQEKLVLLWHDHFACQESKVVRQPMLLDQNRTFRRLAAGPFRALLGALARDPAMLHYLDNRESTRAAPNENWARELLELFALGVDHYTQRDVVELARVFTGWTTPNRNENLFRFVPEMHDPSDKVLFDGLLVGREGEAGIAEGEEALDRIAARPDCAVFLARKLLEWFADHAPDAAAVRALAEVLAQDGLEVRGALRVLFRSAWFYAPERRYSMLRNPVDLVVSAARAIGVQAADLAGLERATHRMGMKLFEPPSVAGWEHGLAWGGPGTAAARLDVALALAELPHAARRVVGRATIDLDALAPVGPEAWTAEALVAALLERLLPDDTVLAGERRAALIAFAEVTLQRHGLRNAPAGADPRAPRAAARAAVRAVLHLTLALPEVALA